MLADIGTIFGFIRLIIAVDDFHHALAQYAVHIAGEDFVPVAVPQHLDFSVLFLYLLRLFGRRN